MIISHIRKIDDKNFIIQSNAEHLIGVSKLAGSFADEFNMGDWARVAGILHDKGKEKKDFQTYIKLESGYGAESCTIIDKSHAYVGALLAKALYHECGNCLTNIIAGHHAGLYDYLDLEKLLAKPIPEEVDKNIVKIKLSFPLKNRITKENYNHLVRMLYSCLVDADYLDTEAFMNSADSDFRGGEKIVDLLPLLKIYLKRISENAPNTKVNIIRAQVQKYCVENSEFPTGIYSLTVPTGGGKTLSSLLWAMLHAIKNNKKRIIIAIPYTSIISQTASLLRKIFGEDSVLEHTCNYFPENDGESYSAKLKKHELARQNWDSPIIVTTNVQLFESMYASHPGKCRKLHNIANSVIILDEVQTLPGERLQPIVDAVKAYNKLFGVSVLFTTASQPTLEGRRPGHEKDLVGFDKIRELVPRELSLDRQLKRVEIEFADSQCAWDYAEIADKISENNRVLCVVNTRKDAKEIFNRLNGVENVFHLSRMMCSAHIDDILDRIRCILKSDSATPVRIVSTQLIEAGVDIDLPFVMRQEAGLDSILQAAGRCNREGLSRELGKVVVFKIKGRTLPNGTLSFANQARLNMGPQKDWFSPEAISEYFTQYYSRIPNFDKLNAENYSVSDMLYNYDELMFSKANDSFKLIDDVGESIIVPYGKEGPILIDRLLSGHADRPVYRKLNRYIVNLRERDFEELEKNGMIEKFEDFYILKDSSQYNDETGLNTENHWPEEILIC